MMRIVFLVGLFGCGGQTEEAKTPETPPATESSPGGGAASIPLEIRAAQVANAIAANPDDAEAILSKSGFTEAEFETLLYEIAADPGRTDAFRKARKQ